MSNFNWPINPTTVNSGPIQFVLDSVNQEVTEDTVDPSNNRPLPVKIFDASGNPVTTPESRGFSYIGVAGSNIDTSDYTDLTPSLISGATEFEINNTTGKSLYLAFGAAASEVDQLIIPPGGLKRQALAFPANVRVSLKAVAQTANVGEVSINYFG